MTDPRKDFTPIRDDYAFFASHSTEADADLDAYADGLRHLSPCQGLPRILDFGCGPGSFTSRFLARSGWRPDQLELTLVDPSDIYRQQAVEHLTPLTTHPILALGALPNDLDRPFDLILSNHVLYYVPDLEAVLRRITHSLAPGGLFLTAIAGRENALIDLWIRSFALIGRPVPYQTAEDVETTLVRLGVTFFRKEIHYLLRFPDSPDNRLKILRFLLGETLDQMPLMPVLNLFSSYSASGIIAISTTSRQYHIHAGKPDWLEPHLDERSLQARAIDASH